MVGSISYRWVTLWVTLVPFVTLADKPPTDVDARFAIIQAQLDALNKRLEQLEQMPQSRLPAPGTTTDTTATDTTVTDKTVNDTTATDTTTTDVVDNPPPAVTPRAQPELAAYQELEALRTNWKQLQRGLSRTELNHLLGKPRSELTLDQQTLWYYRYPGIGGGSVILDSKGKVTGWQEPPFHGW